MKNRTGYRQIISIGLSYDFERIHPALMTLAATVSLHPSPTRFCVPI